jgi:hypothetical protein
MKQVKLIIANTETDTVYFNYGDDYSDITRVLVEDHSPWEEVEDDDLYQLEDFVRNFNLPKNKNKSFAFLVVKQEQITAQSAIDFIVKKRQDERNKCLEAERKRKEEAERKKKENEMKKLAKTKEQKILLLEQLKKELGE